MSVQGLTIIITLPHFFSDEAERIEAFLREGKADIVHIRKPDSSEKEMRNLIEGISKDYMRRLVLHDHHFLAKEYDLYGVHLNGRNPLPPEGWCGAVSRSCHSFAEVIEWKQMCDYVSLSPIFDSVSKQGYLSAFSNDDIVWARTKGIIDSKVLALGGVTFNKLPEVLSMGFGGGMILGDAWK